MSYKKETSNSPLRNQLFKNPPSPLKNSLVTTNLCYNLFFSLYFYHQVEFFGGFFSQLSVNNDLAQGLAQG